MQWPSCRGLSQGVQTRLGLAVFHVRSEHERHIEKDLLNFGLADLVFIFTLAVVASIPIEPFDLLEVDQACIFS